MTVKITALDLSRAVSRLNAATGSPDEYTTHAAGQPFSAALGHFHVCYENNATFLARTVNTAGAITRCTSEGTKRETWLQVQAMLTALNFDSVSTLQGQQP